MNGITIFSHSFRQVLGNLNMAIRISGGFWLLLICVIVAYMFVISLTNSGFLAVILGAGAVVFAVWGVSLIAVVWHRYILKEELPSGFIPRREGLNIWPYFWSGIGIALIVGVAMLVLYFVASFFIETDRIFAAFDQRNASLALFDLGLLFSVSLFSSLIYLRLALILPAVALGESFTLGDSWSETKGHNFAIIVIALLLTVLSSGVSMLFNVAMLALASSPFLLFAISLLNLAFQWFYFMLNISILSTLYGHIVQKREVY